MNRPIWIANLCGAIFLTLSAGIQAEQYKAFVTQSKWKAQSSPLSCTLDHEIPGLGKATISHDGGYDQSFNLHLLLPRTKPGTSRLVMMPPHWKFDQERRRIGKFKVQPGHDPIQFEKQKTYDLLSGLAQGMNAIFYITPASSFVGGHEDKVFLSPVGFQKAYQEYIKCVDNLIPFKFTEIKESTVHFESGSSIISNEDEETLLKIAKYVKSDGKIRQIKLFGHSDSKGGFQANRQLAYERMWAVKDYFVMKHGLPNEMFKMKDMVDKAPVAKNKTREGRAKNRRVVIELYR